MKTGASGKPFTTAGKFNRDKFIAYKQHNSILVYLCRQGYGVEINADMFIILSVVRCPETYKFRTIKGRFRITKAFLNMTQEQKIKLILNTIQK